MLSYEIDQKLTRALIQLGEKFVEKNILLQGLREEERLAIHRYARISMIGASTRIENAALTDSEIDWIDDILSKNGKKTGFEVQRKKIQHKLRKDKERSIEEVAGCRTMLHLIYEQGHDYLPFTETILRGLHAELMRYDMRSGLLKGTYKIHSNKVIEKNHDTGEERVIFETADPGPVTATAMSDLISWYNKAYSEVPWAIPLACEFVFRFLAIHPFQDGNGRVGRGLFLMCLLQSKQSSIANVSRYLAIDRHIERYKEEYYLVLNQCSDGKFLADAQKYRLHYFLHFMIKVLDAALQDIAYYLKKHHAYRDLSESALRIFSCFKEKPELRLNTQDICSETKLARRTVIYALNQLIKHDFIQRHGKGAGTRYQLVF